MAILCDIKKMSQNPSFGYWCIKSKDKIADWLDLSRTTVFSGINTLIKKGLIERSEFGLRPSKVIYMLDMAQEDIGLLIKNNDIELITKKIQEVVDGQYKNWTMPVQKLDSGSTESELQPSKNCTQDIHLDNNLKKIKKVYKPFVPPTIDDVKMFFKQEGYREDVAIHVFKYYSDGEWSDSKGNPVKNWKQKIRGVWFKDENKITKKSTNPAASVL